MSIRWSSINKKIKEFVNSDSFKKAVYDQYSLIITGKVKTANGESRSTFEAADKFILCLTTLAEYDLHTGMIGPTAAEALEKWDFSKSVKAVGDHFQIEINYNDDPFRKSVQPEMYGGVRNIVTLLNSGYSARRPTYGMWETPDGPRHIATRDYFEGTHFIERAIDMFMDKYADQYGVEEILFHSEL